MKETHIERLERLKKYDGLDQVVTFKKAKFYYDKIKKPTILHKTGIDKLNYFIGGIETQELITISGITGEGKSLFCRTLTNNLSKQGVNCLWFTYEEQPEKFISRFPEIPDYACLPLQTGENTLEWIEERILEGMAKYNTSVVFIDHLHYLVPLSKNINMSLVIGDVMRKLKILAVKLNITIVIIAHLEKVNVEEQPDLKHIRDSGLIACESDTVLIIWRKYEKEGKGRNAKIKYLDEAMLKVAKCRSTGRVGIIDLKYKNKLFYELSGEDLSKDGLTYEQE